MDRRLGIKIVWLFVGLTSVALGAAGTVVPLLPATPFFLLAAYAFARSSPRLERWLLEHRHFGPPIANWRAHGAISRRAKLISMIAIVATPIVSIALGAPLSILLVQLLVLSIVSIFILSRPHGPDHENGAS